MGFVNLENETETWITDKASIAISAQPLAHRPFPGLTWIDFSMHILEDVGAEHGDVRRRRHPFGHLAREFVDLMLKYGIPKHLYLSAPRLLYEDWMMPLWEQMEQLEGSKKDTFRRLDMISHRCRGWYRDHPFDDQQGNAIQTLIKERQMGRR